MLEEESVNVVQFVVRMKLVRAEAEETPRNRCSIEQALAWERFESCYRIRWEEQERKKFENKAKNESPQQTLK